MSPVWGHRLQSPCGAHAQGQSGCCLCPAALNLPKADGGWATWELPWRVWPGCALTLDPSLDPEVHAVSAARISRKADPGARTRLHQAGAHALLSTSQVRCTCSVSFSPCPHSSPPALRTFTSCECVSTRTPATCLVLGHLRTSRLSGSFLTSSMYPSCFPCPLCRGHTAVKTFYMSQLLNGTPEICVSHTALMQWIPS